MSNKSSHLIEQDFIQKEEIFIQAEQILDDTNKQYRNGNKTPYNISAILCEQSK